jgi:hypothetical protein
MLGQCFNRNEFSIDMTTEEIMEEARLLIAEVRKKKFSNMDTILVLNAALVFLQTWHTHRSIQQMERDCTGGDLN